MDYLMLNLVDQMFIIVNYKYLHHEKFYFSCFSIPDPSWSGCNFVVDSSKKKADSALSAVMQDSAMVRAAGIMLISVPVVIGTIMGWFKAT